MPKISQERECNVRKKARLKGDEEKRSVINANKRLKEKAAL
jgi:hypothetical protein